MAARRKDRDVIEEAVARLRRAKEQLEPFLPCTVELYLPPKEEPNQDVKVRMVNATLK